MKDTSFFRPEIFIPGAIGAVVIWAFFYIAFGLTNEPPDPENGNMPPPLGHKNG